MNKMLLICASFLLLWGCETETPWVENPVDYVDPFIGTGGHGHTYPGATYPFGMVQLSPDTRLTGWDGCSGYHYSDSLIYGFSHTHLQGTGVSDYGDILIMPTNNEVAEGSNWGERYRSAFRKETEQAGAGYYSVHLDDHALTAELTTTKRVGIHRYTFDKPDSCVVFMDMDHRDALLSYQFEPMGDSMIVGMRSSSAWAEQQTVYFAAVFSEPFEYMDQTYELYETIDPETNTPVQTMEMVPVFPLRFGILDTLQVKIALSLTDIDGALKNLGKEAAHWDFEDYRSDAEKAWDNELGKIKIADTSEEEKTLFYTSLYHSYTVPNIKTDVDGRFRSTDLQIHEPDGKEHYTVFSLWDTFRATHPLYTLLQRERTGAFIHTFLEQYQYGGKLPMWELANNYTGCMIGYHSVPVITDAWAKGIRSFDKDLALEAMLSTATAHELGKEVYMERGYIPAETEHESVSKTLEYAYDDWCIAEFLRLSGAGSDSLQQHYNERALSYRNLYNPETGFLQPKRGGSFREGFVPTEVNFNYTEANAWQYNFFTPQDIEGHIALMGESEYESLLDSLFHSSSEITGRDQADITGLIGQYAHGNEPSHHKAYLYPYLGAPWKTQNLVDSIMHHLYSAAPDGIAGNEDCGQMSSWYVLSALGMYPVVPGADYFVFGSPQLERAEITFENGNTLVIRAPRNNESDKYIQRVQHNGKPYSLSYIDYQTLIEGGELIFTMGSTPNKSFGAAEDDRPKQRVDDASFVAVPVIDVPRSFREDAEVRLFSYDEEASLYFRIISEEDTSSWIYYDKPITVEKSTAIEAYAEREELRSATVQSFTSWIGHDWTIEHLYPYDNQYSAGGNDALIDGLKGGNNFKTGEWQGFYGTDAAFIVDLGSVEQVESISLGALQDIRPWIWLPAEVQLFTSMDGENFKLHDTVKHPVPLDDYALQVRRFISDKDVNARYIKVVAKNVGTIPEWHLGNGNDSWIFLDEVEINLAE